MEKYQTFWRRVGAFIIDSIIIIPVNLFVSFVFVFVTENRASLRVSTGGFVAVFYYILTHYYYGQTVGKAVAKVKVLDDSEIPINLGQAILRSLPQLVPVMFFVSFSTADRANDSIVVWSTVIQILTSLFFLASVVVCLANEKRRGLHDFIAGTVVVRTDI